MNYSWKPTTLDILLSSIIALGLPPLAMVLYKFTGALVPMILYYGLAWGIVKWRRGSTGYFSKNGSPAPVSFYINTVIILIALALAYQARIVVPDYDMGGIFFTALIWATINASSEQLLWIYIFEAWDLFEKQRQSRFYRWGLRVVGLLFFTIFVGLIHTMFWTQFLHTVDASKSIGVLFVIITSLSGYFHLLVWRKSGRMIFTFIPHFLLNLIPLVWTGYSIWPYLWLA